MRKMAFLLVMVMLLTTLAAPITAMAAEPRVLTILPELTFEGTTAKCSVSIAGNTLDEHIEAVIKLYRDSTCIATWRRSGDGYLFFTGSKNVVAGYTYKLTVQVTVDDTEYSPVYTTATL